MYNIGYYVQNINRRSRPIHFGVYQKQQNGLNYSPGCVSTPPKPEATLSPQYKKPAEQFTQTVLTALNIGKSKTLKVEQATKQPLNVII